MIEPMHTEETESRPGRARVTLNLAAVLIVTVWLLYPRGVRPDLLGLIVGLVALAAWAGWAIVRAGRPRTALLVIAALAGAAAVGGTDALLISAVIAAVISFVATPGHRMWSVVALVAVVAAVLGVESLMDHRDAPFLLSVFGGLVLAVLVGVTRRQGRLAESRERELLARALDAERESARAALLADRTAAARDIHDVLAHSLGGLVIQLDAAEALLEAGQIDSATQRVVQARRLAVDGLADARRAVSALRDEGASLPRAASGVGALADGGTPDPDASADDALGVLVATHRSLGFTAVVDGELGVGGLSTARRVALGRAVQEALSNARRHAPESLVRIRSTRADGFLSVSIATALPASSLHSAPTATEHGHGLIGMRERFTKLGDGSSVSAGPICDDFVVEASVPLSGVS